jgi:HAE1 family hydrophobic/amphiphilic exporter-1
VLVFQFDSYYQPIIILLSLPLAIVGVVAAHLLLGLKFGTMSYMGIVTLAGVAVNDAILIVDTVNYLRREKNLNSLESIAEAGRMRFVPVIITSITTIGGLLPLAMYNDAYSQMGYSLVFGLVASTILILLVIPVILYQVELLLDRAKSSFKIISKSGGDINES